MDGTYGLAVNLDGHYFPIVLDCSFSMKYKIQIAPVRLTLNEK